MFFIFTLYLEKLGVFPYFYFERELSSGLIYLEVFWKHGEEKTDGCYLLILFTYIFMIFGAEKKLSSFCGF